MPPYVSWSSKATSICNLILRYLQCLTVNIIFPPLESQGVPCYCELFALWAALYGVCINTGFHIATQLEEQAKSSITIITTGDIVTPVASGLGLGNLSLVMPILDAMGCLNLAFFVILVGGQGVGEPSWSSPIPFAQCLYDHHH